MSLNRKNQRRELVRAYSTHVLTCGCVLKKHEQARYLKRDHKVSDMTEIICPTCKGIARTRKVHRV